MAAVGSLTITKSNNNACPDRPVRKYTFAWTCTAGGAVSGIASEVISGEILRVVTNPGDGPSDDYDAVLLDGDGLDVLAGQGANRDTTNSEHFCPGVPLNDGTTTSTARIAVDGPLELQISNAGASKSGTLVLYVR